jgi:anti-sigma regulatory factor (Ser/Thr protein kinase)
MEWQLPAIVEAVVLAVSELVTNAVVHGRPPVALTVRRGSDEVRIGVHDNNPQAPPLSAITAHSRHATSGRGLGIVTVLADSVGCEQVPDDGKIVYASFRTTPEAPRTGVAR